MIRSSTNFLGIIVVVILVCANHELVWNIISLCYSKMSHIIGGFSVSIHCILNKSSTKISMYMLLQFSHNQVKRKHIILFIT